MSAPDITGMARDMARELLNDDDLFFEVVAEVDDDDPDEAIGWIDEVTHDGLGFLETWLRRAYEAGRKAAQC